MVRHHGKRSNRNKTLTAWQAAGQRVKAACTPGLQPAAGHIYHLIQCGLWSNSPTQCYKSSQQLVQRQVADKCGILWDKMQAGLAHHSCQIQAAGKAAADGAVLSNLHHTLRDYGMVDTERLAGIYDHGTGLLGRPWTCLLRGAGDTDAVTRNSYTGVEGKNSAGRPRCGVDRLQTEAARYPAETLAVQPSHGADLVRVITAAHLPSDPLFPLPRWTTSLWPAEPQQS